MSDRMTENLNRHLANWLVFAMKLRHCHWYVAGPHFFTLHAKFGELYAEADRYADEVAERILALGGRPVSTMQACLSQAVVAEAVQGWTVEAMVGAVLEDLRVLALEMRQLAAEADGAGDVTTHDLVASMLARAEKEMWMLGAFLGR